MNGKNMNIKREQAKNKIQFILDAMTLKGKRVWKNHHLYKSYRDRVCETIMKIIEETFGELK